MSDESPPLVLVDTNVFIYAYDPANAEMRALAQELVDRLARSIIPVARRPVRKRSGLAAVHRPGLQ